MAGLAHVLHVGSRGAVGHLVGAALEGGEHGVHAVGQGHVGIHEAVSVVAEEVGDDEASESPLAAEDVIVEGADLADPFVAEESPALHRGVGTALLDRDLERLQVDLTHGLLGRPGADHLAVGVIHGKMLDGGVHALGQCACHGVRCHVACQHAVLREVLVVSGREGASVGIHSRCVPAGDVHLLAGLAHDLAPLGGQVVAPGAGDHDFDREAQAAGAGEVVVDSRGTVGVHVLDFFDGRDRRGLVTGEGDHAGHFVHGQLVEEGIPLRIVIVETAHVVDLQVSGCAGGGHLRGGIHIGHGVVVGVQVIAFHIFGGHVQVRGSRRSCIIVGKMVRSGEEDHVALGILQAVDRCHVVAGTGVGLVVDDLGSLREDLAVENGVRVAADADLVVARFEDVAAVSLLIIGGELLELEGHGQGLGLAGLEHAGLGVADQVGGCFFDAAVGVRRIGVDFHNVLACAVAGIGHGHVEGDLVAAHLQLAHLLLEAGVGQAVAEGILHDLVVVDDALRRRGLKELVADVDVLDVVDEGRRIVGGDAAVHALDGHVHEVGVVGLLGIVVVRSAVDVVDEGVVGLAGGVHGAAKDLAESREADVAGAGSPHDGLDLRILLGKTKLKRIRTVVDQDDFVEILADQVHHVALGAVQLQVVLTRLKVIVLGRIVIEDGLGHILGDIVVALARHTGDHDDRRVGVGLGVVHQLLGVVLRRHFGQVPVLGRDGDRRAVLGVGLVEVKQLLVDGEARLLQPLPQAHDGEEGVDAARARAAIDRVGGGPTEQVQLLGGLHGQEILFILQKDESFPGHVQSDLLGRCRGLLSDLAGPGRQRQQRLHGTEADHIYGNGDAGQRGQPGPLADQALQRLGLLIHCDRDDDGRDQHHRHGDQVGLQALQYANEIFHLKRNHVSSLSGAVRPLHILLPMSGI